MHTLLILIAMSADSLTPGEHLRELSVDGLKREYIVFVPKVNAQPKDGFPLVLAFHGGGSNARQMVQFSGLNATAEKHGFVVVYPNGTGRVEAARTFNAGNCCGYAQRQNVDDVKFTRELLKDVEAVVPIDKRRIYATGMSNGALMSYRLADEMSDVIAAIAPVAGPMGQETCTPAKPVPVCHFHGTEDEFAAYGGGAGKRSLTRTNFYSVEHTLAQWVKANGCKAEPRVTELTPTVDDGTKVTRYEYEPARGGGAPVVHYKIEGGGHTWPGHETRIGYLGKVTKNLDANEVMWQFFKDKTR